MIKNLNNAKNLRCNTPIFHPDDDFKIPKDSLAILIEVGGKIQKRKNENNNAA
jgi:hypothetical protein